MMPGREAFPFEIATFHRGHWFILCAVYVSKTYATKFLIILPSVYILAPEKRPKSQRVAPLFPCNDDIAEDDDIEVSGTWSKPQTKTLYAEKKGGAERSNLLVCYWGDVFCFFFSCSFIFW